VFGSKLSTRCHVHTSPDNHLMTYPRKIFDNKRTATELRNVWDFTCAPHVASAQATCLFYLPTVLSKFRISFTEIDVFSDADVFNRISDSEVRHSLIRY